MTAYGNPGPGTETAERLLYLSAFCPKASLGLFMLCNASWSRTR